MHLAEQAVESALDRLELHKITAKAHVRRARGGTGMSLLVWARGKSHAGGISRPGPAGGPPLRRWPYAAVESLVDFLHSGAGLPASLAAFLLAPLCLAAGTSRLTVDRSTMELKAAVQAVQAVHPGAIRFNQPREGLPWELSLQGRS